jgi:hypothetical protein
VEDGADMRGPPGSRCERGKAKVGRRLKETGQRRKRERERGGPRAERERGEGVKGFCVCLFVFLKPFPNLFKLKHFFKKNLFKTFQIILKLLKLHTNTLKHHAYNR